MNEVDLEILVILMRRLSLLVGTASVLNAVIELYVPCWMSDKGSHYHLSDECVLLFPREEYYRASVFHARYEKWYSACPMCAKVVC